MLSGTRCSLLVLQPSSRTCIGSIINMSKSFSGRIHHGILGHVLRTPHVSTSILSHPTLFHRLTRLILTFRFGRTLAPPPKDQFFNLLFLFDLRLLIGKYSTVTGGTEPAPHSGVLLHFPPRTTVPGREIPVDMTITLSATALRRPA